MRYTVLLVLITALSAAGPSTWTLSPDPPSGSEIAAALEEDPIGVLMFVARSRWVPEGVSVDSLAECVAEDMELARIGAWAARMAGSPFNAALEVSSLEYGAWTLLPTDVQLAGRPEFVEAVLRRVLHSFAEGSRPDSVAGVVRMVTEVWDRVPYSTRALGLEVLGKLAVDVTGDISDSQILEIGLLPAARYWSEIGVIHSFPMGGECLPLESMYIAACEEPWVAAFMLSDQNWAVRFRALERCGADAAAALLDDPVPYVALQAAVLRRDSGYADGAERIRSLTGTPGPVGLLAVEALGREDSLLLREMMASPSGPMRAAAQSAWIADSLPVNDALEQAWISDPYWVVPINRAWQLTDQEDSLGVERVLDLLLSSPDAELATPELISHAEYLRDRLRGMAAEEIIPWRGFDLPFQVLEGGEPYAVIHTGAGDFTIELWDDVAPVACAGFRYLAASGFYDGLTFHRVIPGFVAQGGCPDGNGVGGPGYELPGEPSLMSFERGVVGMADSGPDTAGSQFFIMLDHHGRLDGRYTAFGKVVDTGQIDGITVGTVITGVTLVY